MSARTRHDTYAAPYRPAVKVLYEITMAGESAGAKKGKALRSRSKGSRDGREMTQEDKPLVQGALREAERDTRESEKAKLGAVTGSEEMEERHPSSRLVATCFLGIFVSYFIYGLLQEKITKRTFGGESFHFFMFLVLFQCMVNTIFARVGAWYMGVEPTLKPYRHYIILSFSYVAAMVASNSSLAYISYPTQVLGKSAKPIPVLILGVLLSHKRYPPIKYLIVLLIVVGVAIFLYRDDKTEARHNEAETPHAWRLFHFVGLGELLVFLSLTFDGVTGAIQERLRRDYSTSAFQMMFAVNVYSCVYLFVACVMTGEGLQSVAFIYRHPEVLLNLLMFAVSSAVGQLFIFTTITHLGPLTCSIFTTTRKFFTILASVIIFANPLISRQWVGVVLVFLGLGLDMFYGKAKNGGGGKGGRESGKEGKKEKLNGKLKDRDIPNV